MSPKFSVDVGHEASFPSVSHIALALALAQAAAAPTLTGSTRYSFENHLDQTAGGQVQFLVRDHLTERTVLSAIAALHDRLLAEAEELPARAEALMLANLRDLYL